jgi:drug/metabolite transporter (DMT)-like permease
MLSTAFGLSLHSIAGGGIARQLVGEGGGLSLVVMVVVTSLFIGILVGCIVQVGEWERGPLTKFFDKIPGLLSGALILIAGWCAHHLLQHLTEISTLAQYFYCGAIFAVAFIVGRLVHERTSRNNSRPSSFALEQDDSSSDIPSLVKLSSRKA